MSSKLPVFDRLVLTFLATALVAACFFGSPPAISQDGFGLDAGDGSMVAVFGVATGLSWSRTVEVPGVGDVEILISPGTEPLMLKVSFEPVGGSSAEDEPAGESKVTKIIAGSAALLGGEITVIEGRPAVALILSEGGPEGKLHSFWIGGASKTLAVASIEVLTPVTETGQAGPGPAPEGTLVFGRGDGALELYLMERGPSEGVQVPFASRAWVLKKSGWIPCDVPIFLRGTSLSRLMRLGDEHFLKGDYARAGVYYGRAVQADPFAGRAPAKKSPVGVTGELIERAYFYLGKSRERSLDLDGAILGYQAFIDRFPTSDLASSSQDEASFLDDLRRAAPEAGKAFIIARNHFEAGRLDEAREALDPVLSAKSIDSVPVLVCRVRYMSGLMREKTGDISGAVADYKAAMNCRDDPSTSRQAARAVVELKK